MPAGLPPSIEHVCVRIAGFDRKIAAEKLRKPGAEILPSNDEALLRFRDPNGMMLELKAGLMACDRILAIRKFEPIFVVAGKNRLLEKIDTCALLF